MTIGEQYSSFSQYYQQTPSTDQHPKSKSKPKLPENRTHRQFLQNICTAPDPTDMFPNDEGYLSDEDSENSLDEFIVPDDYPSEYDSESDEQEIEMDVEEDLSKRKSLTRAAKNSESRKRYREEDVDSQPETKRKKTVRASDPKWIRFKKSVEYSNLTEEYENNGSYKIVGRDDEVHRIIRLVTQENGGIRPLLIGSANIGKCGTVKHLAETLANLKEKNPLCARSVVMLDCQAVVSNWIASVDELQVAMVVRQKVTNLLKNFANPIIFFRNIDAFLKYDEPTDFLRSFFRQPINMIASISGEEKSEIVGKCQKILAPYNFKTIQVNECAIEHLPTIIRQNLEAHPFPYKNMKLSNKALNTAIRLADKHIKDRPFPIKAINLIRETASYIYYTTGEEGENRAIKPEDIAEVVHQETGITVKELMSNSLGHMVHLEAELKGKIVGQEKAIKTVCSHVKQSRIGLGRVDRPAGVLLFVGPSGVGKTLLAMKLAEGLFHDKQGFERINMEGYSAPTSLSKLIGTDPGYVGYEQVGSLDGKIARRPHLVVLFDEIEKAHPEVQNFLLGLFDTGFFENGKGQKIDCRNVIFIMTSNVGAKELLTASKKKDLSEDEVLNCVDAPLKDNFRAEFLNRMDEIVAFRGLKEADCPEVVKVHLEDIQYRYYRSHKIKLSWSDSVIDHFADIAYRPEYGMRNLGKEINKFVARAVTDLIEREELAIAGKVHIDINNEMVVAEKLITR